MLLMLKKISSLLLFLCFCWSGSCFGLEPKEVLVVANKDMEGSVDLAKYYMEKRGIPTSHLLSLSLTDRETMARQEYDDVLAQGVLKTLEKLKRKQKHRIDAIVLMYGVPLKVAPSLPGFEALDRISKHRENQNAIIENGETPDPNASDIKKDLKQKIQELLNTNQRAAVDSELSLVKVEKYDLAGWIKNPFYVGFQGQGGAISTNQVLLVCRLDGPDVETVYRVIDDSLWAEENGLNGRAYFDARWPEPTETEGLGGYAVYDYSLHRAADIARQRMEVVLDETAELFPEQACPEAAVYCGWYSLGKYRDSFEWQRGAVGYHIASSECSTLRKKESSVWCVKMLEKGVAATIGPVYEPYVQGFPVPHVFFNQLLEGYMSLGEAYLVSLPYLSWQMVLVGDPLYQPFRPVEEEADKTSTP
jgi:uncharacterized protein (TIGR03790 family)